MPTYTVEDMAEILIDRTCAKCGVEDCQASNWQVIQCSVNLVMTHQPKFPPYPDEVDDRETIMEGDYPPPERTI